MSDEKCLSVTKNDHFLKLCHEGQIEPPVTNRGLKQGLLVTKNVCFRAIHREQIQKKSIDKSKSDFANK